MVLIKKLKLALQSLTREFIIQLPDEFTKLRVAYYNKRGCAICSGVSISPNVRIRGKITIDEGSSIAQNCSLSASTSSIKIGKDVMIAPNVVIVAFDHGSNDPLIPMKYQKETTAPVTIGDNVWVGANVTITKGCSIGKNCIIGANSVVTEDLPANSICAGVPARVIRINASRS